MQRFAIFFFLGIEFYWIARTVIPFKIEIDQLGEVFLVAAITPLDLKFSEIFRREAFQIIGPFFTLFAGI
jgi:hypothetical protein